MDNEISNKLVLIILIILIIGTIVLKAIPQFQSSLGSSDTKINYDNKNKLVGLKYNNQAEIILVIYNDKVNNVIFLNDYAYVLYNKNIEGNSFIKSLDRINNILQNENILNEEQNIIEITKYNNAENEIKIIKQVYNNMKIIENNITLKEKSKLLGINNENDEQILKKIEQYSKEIIRRNKNNISKNNKL